MKKKGTLFIIAAPSGAGKTSLVKAITDKHDNICVSVSHTTRPPRQGEVNGEAYHFVDEAQFKTLINQGHFLEYAKVFDNYYGTSSSVVEQALAEGKNIILEIDWQGARQIASKMRGTVSIFILPPSYDTLKQRLTGRQNDDEAVITRRMAAAQNEIAHYSEFDYIVINDDFSQALAEIEAIITSTNLSKCRQSDFYEDFIARNMAQKD